MISYYDSNFGHYDMTDDDCVDFYNEVQRRSVTKTCQGCGDRVELLPQYNICDDCATKLENGLDLDLLLRL